MLMVHIQWTLVTGGWTCVSCKVCFFIIKPLNGYCMVLVSEPVGEHHHCQFVIVSRFYVNCEIGSTFLSPSYKYHIKKDSRSVAQKKVFILGQDVQNDLLKVILL
jgi:hypothetical protein